jgi:ATP-dependent metalloprotease
MGVVWGSVRGVLLGYNAEFVVQGGHAIVAVLTEGATPVYKATIVPRGSALGMVTQLAEKDEVHMTFQQMLARLDVCMGGRVAEEVASFDT